MSPAIVVATVNASWMKFLDLTCNIYYFLLLKDEYKRLEVLAFEMETTIASLEEELAVTREEKEETILRAETLASELHAISEELNMSNVELATLREEVSCLVSFSWSSRNYFVSDFFLLRVILV